MPKPYILAAGDDPAELRAVEPEEPDLKTQFGSDYSIPAADSPEQAIGFVWPLMGRAALPPYRNL
jgi:hypothetical protein